MGGERERERESESKTGSLICVVVILEGVGETAQVTALR